MYKVRFIERPDRNDDRGYHEIIAAVEAQTYSTKEEAQEAAEPYGEAAVYAASEKENELNGN